eukprot:24076-Pelagomonas_calceolata.AAC.2
MAGFDVLFMELPGWNCAASHFLITSQGLQGLQGGLAYIPKIWLIGCWCAGVNYLSYCGVSNARGKWVPPESSKEPPERKGEIKRRKGQRTGKHIYAGENRPGGDCT